jgi:hypothetical protein
MFRRTPSGVPSPFFHHNRHPRHEERQQEEDDGVAEGVAHAVVEELHPGLGPEEFRGMSNTLWVKPRMPLKTSMVDFANLAKSTIEEMPYRFSLKSEFSIWLL